MRASPPPEEFGGRLRLTSEGLAWLGAAGLLGLLGWTKSLNLLLILAYVMIALAVVNGVLARIHAKRFRAHRVLPHPVFAGESATITAHVQNTGSRLASAEILDRESAWNAVSLAPGATAVFSRIEHYPRRGRITLPPLVVSSGYPFGFLRFDQTQPGLDAVRVLPAPGLAEPDGLRHWVLQRAGFEGRSRKVLRRVTHDLADVRGVRPYRPGDSIRAIHWRSTARRRELMVREYDAAPSPELVLVVEPWLPANPTMADQANLEAALSLAATVVQTWCRAIATRITVVVAGEAEPASGPANDSFLREALAPLSEATGSETFPLPDVRSVARLALRAARVIVSSRVNTPLAEGLAREIGKPFVTLDPIRRLPWYRPPGLRGDA